MNIGSVIVTICFQPIEGATEVEEETDDVDGSISLDESGSVITKSETVGAIGHFHNRFIVAVMK